MWGVNYRHSTFVFYGVMGRVGFVRLALTGHVLASLPTILYTNTIRTNFRTASNQ